MSLAQNDSRNIDIKDPHYQDTHLPKEFHQKKRNELRKLMPDSSVAFFFSNPLCRRSNDVYFEFHQEPNLYYLTGLTEPDAVLVLFKSPTSVDGEVVDELLFVAERDSLNEIWNGKKLGTEGVERTLGIKRARINKDFKESKIDLKGAKVALFLPFSDLLEDDKSIGYDLASLMSHADTKLKLDSVRRDDYLLKEFMSNLRQTKEREELEFLRSAIQITCEAQIELMKAIHPGMKEYESEAIIEYVFKKRGAEYPGFPSILGSGENSCVLHYVTNRRTLGWDDLLVSDVGAEYRGYTADVTRTIPANGEYSKEQTLIYELVLKAQLAGIAQCKKGKKFWDPHDAAKKIIQEGLMELGLINDPSEYRRYFMHGTSHYLGLDVHDAGLYGPLKPNMVITVEPGIYIPEHSDCDPKWWNIGVRIEDDILITNGEPEVLSDCVPKTIPEIINIVKEKSIKIIDPK
ncbi:MAG: aminopeptidase P family protein [Flavobacteriales bacterium]|nr:aminopeptidase P family protein [Flavobacteriales bacterium]